MVLLCPRFPGDKDGANYSSLTQSRPPYSPVDPTSEEHRMLQVIFNTSGNQTTGLEETGLTSPSATPPRLQLSRSKSGRARLGLLSNKLRRRFSRDARPARLLAKPSDSPCDGTSDTDNGGLFQCTVTSADVLGIDTASDCGYDSDAHKLLTPQITARLRRSPCNLRVPHILKENPPEANRLYLQGYDGAPGEIIDHTVEHGGGGTLGKPTLDFNSQIKSGEIHHTSDNQFFSDRPSKSIHSSRSTSETLRRSFSASTSPNKNAKPRMRNCFSHSSLSLPNISIQSDQNERLRAETLELSFFGYASSGQHLMPQANEPPNPKLYTSLNPTNSATMGLKTEISMNTVKEPRGNPTQECEETVDISNMLESTEIVHDKSVPSRNEQRPKSPTCPVSTGPIQSRFIENLDDVFSPRVRGQYLEPTDHIHGRSKTRSSSDGWLSGGKRVGYGYSFILETDGEILSTPTSSSKAPMIQPGTVDYGPESPTYLTIKGRKLRGLEQENQRGNGVVDQAKGSLTTMSPLQNPIVLKAANPNIRYARNQRSSSFPPWANSTEQSIKAADSSAAISTRGTAANINSLATGRDGQHAPAASNSNGNIFLKYLGRLSRANSLNAHQKNARLDSHPCHQLKSVHQNDTSMEPNENQSPELPHGLQHYQNHSAEGKVSSRSAQFSCGEIDSRKANPAPLPTSGIYDESLEDTDSEGSLIEGCSADAWSRLYEDCVQFPPCYNRSTSACSGLFTTAYDKRRNTDNCAIPIPSPREDHTSTTERTDLPLMARYDSKESVPQVIENSWSNSVLQTSGTLHI